MKTGKRFGAALIFVDAPKQKDGLLYRCDLFPKYALRRAGKNEGLKQLSVVSPSVATGQLFHCLMLGMVGEEGEKLHTQLVALAHEVEQRHQCKLLEGMKRPIMFHGGELVTPPPGTWPITRLRVWL